MSNDRLSFGEELTIYALATFLIGAIFFIIALPMMLLRGFIFMKLWNWFVFGQLTNYKMGWIVGSGIALLTGWITAQTFPVKDERTNKEKMLAIGIEIVSPLLTLFFGWILTLFL